MKKNLALILALVMLMGTIFSVIPAAAAEATASVSYEPKVSYANINYSDKMYMMFAVPAPTSSIGEGNTVHLLVWNGIESESYSFKDTNVEILSAEADKALIDGAWHYVFKYDGLTAAEMTKIISARPVIVNTWEETVKVEISPEEKNEAGEVIKEAVYEDKIEIHKDAVEYGDIVEYSVLEYVATAKGEFGGTALAKDVIAMLDSMLAFGSLAQTYSGSEYEFLADDELGKIWYVPVINGVEGEKVFGGFFKKGADLVTVSAPHYDNYSFVSYIDDEGNAIYDVDGLVDNGDQVYAPAEGDLEIKANYSLLYMAKANANDATKLSTNLYDDGSGNKYLGTQGHLGFNSTASKLNPVELGYSALDIVDDPYQPGNKVHRISGTYNYALGMGDSTNDWKFSMKPSAVAGFGDTVDPIVTIDMTIARGPSGEILTTNHLRIRSNQAANVTNIGYFYKDGSFRLYTSSDTTQYITLPTKVAETGYTRYVFIVDFANEVIYAYAAQNADTDPLVYQAQTSTIYDSGTHATAATWMDWAKTLDRIELVGQDTRFSEEELATLLADLDGDGVGETPMIKDGVANKEAVRWCANYYRSTYLRNYSTYVGSPVAIPESFDMYDIDANSATATTKNSQIQVTNFGDEHLKGDQLGTNFGGIGINTSDPKNADLNTFNQDNLVLNYAGVDIIDDPYQAGNKVYSYNGNLQAVLWHADTIRNGTIRPAYVDSLKISTRAPGFFNGSIIPVITYDMTVGGNGYDRMLETDTIRLRGASNTYVHLFKIAADGSILVCTPNETYTDVIFVDTGVDVRKDGYTRIVAEVDCGNEQFRLYAANEGESLKLIATIDTLWITSTSLSHNTEKSKTNPKSFDTWMAMAKVIDRTEIMIDWFGANELTAEELATVDTIDAAAAQSLYRAYRALLIKDWDSYLGRAK